MTSVFTTFKLPRISAISQLLLCPDDKCVSLTNCLHHTLIRSPRSELRRHNEIRSVFLQHHSMSFCWCLSRTDPGRSSIISNLRRSIMRGVHTTGAANGTRHRPRSLTELRHRSNQFSKWHHLRCPSGTRKLYVPSCNERPCLRSEAVAYGTR